MGGNVTSANPQVQETFARRMEEFLYKSSKSVEQYADIKTIDKRLQALMSRMHQRRNTTATTKVGVASGAPPPAAAAGIKQRKRTDTPQEQRKREVLVKILGQAKMIQVFNIVAEIKLIQLGRDVTEGKPFKPIRKCTSSGCSFMVPMAGSQKVPQVVRDLFFNTAIVPALERTSPDHYASLPWDQLIAQGERRLKSYHEWYQRRRQGAS